MKKNSNPASFLIFVLVSCWRLPGGWCFMSPFHLTTTAALGVSLLAISPSQVSSFPDEITSKDTAKIHPLERFLESVPEAPADPILGIASNYRNCKDPRKVNVCVGAYRDEEGKPWVLPSVRQAARQIAKEDHKEYLPIGGDAEFVKQALMFSYGPEAPLERIAAVQTLSGTGACRIGGEFLSKFWSHIQNPTMERPILYLPSPTWGNHFKIFRNCGMDVRTYPYYDRTTHQLDLEGMLETLESAPDGSIILLHACAHNPTGCDPTHDEWKDIADVLLAKGHIVFLDSAYQGFASGHAPTDAYALRYLVYERQLPLVLLAQSFAKNFGLYGERCGTLSVVCSNPTQAQAIQSQLLQIIRPMYSSPPKHGSSIVRTILSEPTLADQYEQECAHMAKRIAEMREALVEALYKVGSKHDWSHVTRQIGMFAYTGLSQDMCDRLTQEYAIFLTRDGRISLAGLNPGNLDYVAKAIHDVTDGKSITDGN